MAGKYMGMSYHSSETIVVYSSTRERQEMQRSYVDEYEWYTDACENLNIEPERYDD